MKEMHGAEDLDCSYRNLAESARVCACPEREYPAHVWTLLLAERRSQNMDSASVLSLAPRKVRKPAGKVIPKPSQAIPELPVASTSALSEPNPVAAIPESNDAPVTSSATPIAFEEEPEIDKATLKRQADLLFQVEACLSDWGLSRAQELLERISAAEDGCQ